MKMTLFSLAVVVLCTGFTITTGYAKVEKYDGKKVEITCTLDQKSETIHVESIKGLE
jgi:hypothetical protein